MDEARGAVAAQSSELQVGHEGRGLFRRARGLFSRNVRPGGCRGLLGGGEVGDEARQQGTREQLIVANPFGAAEQGGQRCEGFRARLARLLPAPVLPGVAAEAEDLVCGERGGGGGGEGGEGGAGLLAAALFERVCE